MVVTAGNLLGLLVGGVGGAVDDLACFADVDVVLVGGDVFDAVEQVPGGLPRGQFIHIRGPVDSGRRGSTMSGLAMTTGRSRNGSLVSWWVFVLLIVQTAPTFPATPVRPFG